MNSMNKDVKIEFPGIIRVYKDGFVERLYPDLNVPPSDDDPETGVSSKDVKFLSDEQGLSLSARLYLPKITEPLTDQTKFTKLPILVYFHGGAFCLRSPESMVYHRYLNILASVAKVLIVSVKYRLAPEHPLPAAYDDSWSALRFVCSNHDFDPWLTNHGNFDAIFIGGDNAGANIVHNLAIRAGSENVDNQGIVTILGAFLSHPFFLDERSAKLEVGYKMWEFVYPNSPGGENSPMINPMSHGAPSLSGLGCSRVLVLVAGKDDMRDGEVRYYNAIKSSGYGGRIEFYEQDGEDHVYHIVNPDAENSKLLFQHLAKFLQM